MLPTKLSFLYEIYESKKRSAYQQLWKTGIGNVEKLWICKVYVNKKRFFKIKKIFIS